MILMPRLWRTEKGDLVEDGHPEAVFLAYGEADELSEEDAGNVRVAKVHTQKSEAVPTPKKSAGPKSKH